MADVWIPSSLQQYTGGLQQIQVDGSTIRQIISNLELLYPMTKNKLADKNEILPGIAVIIDGESTRLGLLEPVQSDSEVHFLPALGGG